MNKLTVTFIMLTLMLSACSDDPASKYTNAEECAFKESKECADQNCTYLAVKYCETSFKHAETKCSELMELKEFCSTDCGNTEADPSGTYELMPMLCKGQKNKVCPKTKGERWILDAKILVKQCA